MHRTLFESPAKSKSLPRIPADGSNWGRSMLRSFFELLGMPRQEPARVRKPVQIAQDFAVKVRLRFETRDSAFRATANRPREIERGGRFCTPGIGPVLERLVFFQLVHQVRQTVGHRAVGKLESITLKAIQVRRRGGQFAHDDDELVLDREDLLGQEFLLGTRSREAKR